MILLTLEDLQVHDDDLKEAGRQTAQVTAKRGAVTEGTGVPTTSASDPGLIYVSVENVGTCTAICFV